MAAVLGAGAVTDLPFGLGHVETPLSPADYELALDAAFTIPDRWIIGPPSTKYSMAPRSNQGKLPQCGGYTAKDVAAYFAKRGGEGLLDFDPHWAYSHAQARDGIPLPHDGTTGQAIAETLRKEGIPVIGRPNSAAAYRIGSWARLPITEAAISQAMVQYGGPVMIGLAWPENWFYPRGGVLPPPSAQIAGGHLLELVGRDVHVNSGSGLLDNHWGDGRIWRGSSAGMAWGRWRDLLSLIHVAIKVLDVGVAGARPPGQIA